MTLRRRALFAAATLVVAVLVPIVAAETALRAANRPAPVVAGWRALAPERLRLQLNQLGVRGRPIEYGRDDFVVLLVGDSQVNAGACSYYFMPERQLERHLSVGRPVKVFSLAADGWGQDQQLLVLQEYFRRFRADLVLVWETPGNDIWNNVFPTGDPNGVSPKPTYRLDGNVLVGPNVQMGEVVSSPVKLLALLQRHRQPIDEHWERYLPAPYEPLPDYDGPVNDTWQKLWDQDLGVMRTDNMATEKNHVAVQLIPPSPRTTYGVRLTHRLLEEMARLSRTHGAAFMTFWVDTPNTHGAYWLDESPVEQADAEQVYGLNGRYYRASHRQLVANMAAVNASFDTEVIPVTTRHWRVSPIDGHLNEQAVDATMQRLAEAVKRHRHPWGEVD